MPSWTCLAAMEPSDAVYTAFLWAGRSIYCSSRVVFSEGGWFVLDLAELHPASDRHNRDLALGPLS